MVFCAGVFRTNSAVEGQDGPTKPRFYVETLDPAMRQGVEWPFVPTLRRFE